MIIAFIFARGGSKGLPGKNIKVLDGKPLLAHAIECAAASQHVNKVVVSTESFDIAQVAYETGADVIFRPDELATDESPEWLSWQHAIRQIGCDMFVSVPATCPMRMPQDIDRTIEALGRQRKDGQPSLVATVVKAPANPYYVSTVQRGNRILPAFGRNEARHRRQDMPEVFNVVGLCYAAWPQYIMQSTHMFQGHVAGVEVPQERSLDIDTAYDFMVAEGLMANKNFKMLLDPPLIMPEAKAV